MADFVFLNSIDDNKKKDRTRIDFIGTGEVGGKAHSLIIADEIVSELNSKEKYPSLSLKHPLQF